jgi:hypothetical protein
MISSFSAAEYLMRGRPHPRSCFFEQVEFECLLGHDLLQGAGFLAERLDLVAGSRTGRVTGQAALTVRRGA